MTVIVEKEIGNIIFLDLDFGDESLICTIRKMLSVFRVRCIVHVYSTVSIDGLFSLACALEHAPSSSSPSFNSASD